MKACDLFLGIYGTRTLDGREHLGGQALRNCLEEGKFGLAMPNFTLINSVLFLISLQVL